MNKPYNSNFELVAEMNEAFGNPQGDPRAIDMAKLKSQCKNILDEYKELMEAIEAGDFYKIRDALCDIHVFTYGAHHLMGLDADMDMQEVVSAVMTRFIITPDDRLDTMMKHHSKGVTDIYFEGDYPRMIMKSGSDQPDAPKGKFLKSASYREPEFNGLCFAAKPPEGWKESPVGNWGLTKEMQIKESPPVTIFKSNDGA